MLFIHWHCPLFRVLWG